MAWIKHSRRSKLWLGRCEGPRHSDGRRNQLRFTGRTKAEVRAKISRAQADMDAGIYCSREMQTTTVAQLLERWLETKQGRALRTVDTYSATVRTVLIPKLSHQKVAQIRPSDIAVAISQWETEPRRDRKSGTRSATTVRQYLTVLSMAFKMARHDGLRGDNPVEAVQRPEVRMPPKPRTDAAGAAAILRALQGTAAFAPAVTAMTHGIRPGELLGFQRQDMDFERGTLQVRRALEYRGKILQYKVPKSQKSCRVIPLSREVLEVIQRSVDDQEKRLQTLGRPTDSSTPLF